MPQPEPRRIVLAGAGHATMVALTALGTSPRGTTVTLVSRGDSAHYSGMVPGWIEGIYPTGAMSIPLAPFAASSGVQLVSGEITGADAGSLFLADGRAVAYDTLVVNAGSETRLPPPLDHPAVVPAKPFEALMAGLEAQLAVAPSFAVVGGGVAGCEIALAVAARRPDAAVTLIERAPQLLAGHPPSFASAVRRALAARGVVLRLGVSVSALEAGALGVSAVKVGAEWIAAATVVAVTGPAPPAWLAATPFRRTVDGFLAVDAAMRSISHPHVLAVGDAATRPDDPRPKAGVFSVRAGPPLAEALGRIAAGAEPAPVHLQRHALVLLATGERRAIGTRNGVTLQGRWVWWLKDRLDRAFVERLRNLPHA